MLIPGIFGLSNSGRCVKMSKLRNNLVTARKSQNGKDTRKKTSEMESFFIRINVSKKGLHHRCFLKNFANCFRY